MKRVHCLYRVSTKRQVNKSDENDIPLQHDACHEFAKRNGWTITKEHYEKGVSGYKVSATKRDPIQGLKKAAEKGEFDILLVYMFDRIGRIEAETPFTVEWLVQHGVEVWSVTEGEQRFDHHVDKLTNYIRFWQADGESQKTSERVKERMRQMVEKGEYTGGVTPFGYKTVPSGCFNKSGKERVNRVVDDSEAPIVQLIFEKSVREGFGSHRLASLLNSMGIKTHNGAEFQCNTINRMLKNREYCGYYTSGETISPHQPQLQIIDERIYEQAQVLIEQRTKVNEKKTQMALNTKGKTLLSGNIYCAHCDSHMITTGYVDKRIRKDGTLYEARNQRYICSKKLRDSKACDGQSVYLAPRIDKAVDGVVIGYLGRIKDTAKSVALEKRYQTEIAELKMRQREVSQDKRKLEEHLATLSAEIALSLKGDSKFTPDMLSNAIDNATVELRNVEDTLAQLNYEINNSQGAMKKLDHYYDQFVGWAAQFSSAMIASNKQC